MTTTNETIPDECQLCRLLDYRGEEINEPTHSHQVAREDGGTKFVYACERCLREQGWWEQDLLRAPLDEIETTAYKEVSE